MQTCKKRVEKGKMGTYNRIRLLGWMLADFSSFQNLGGAS
jgi:hypothetical protein